MRMEKRAGGTEEEIDGCEVDQLQNEPVNTPVTHTRTETGDPVGRPSNKVYECVRLMRTSLMPRVAPALACRSMCVSTCLRVQCLCALACFVCVGRLIVCCDESTEGLSKARSHSPSGEGMLWNPFAETQKQQQRGGKRVIAIGEGGG